MASNGKEERKRALNDLFAGIDALREAEDPLTAIDAIPGMLRTAIEAISEALETAVVDAIRRAGPYRELRDGVFNKKDQLRGLLDDWDAKRKAEAEEAAEKARDPRSKSDYAVLNAIKATLDEQDTDLVRIRHVDLVTKIKDDLNKVKEEFEAKGLDPSDIEQNINSLANVNNVLGGVKHLKKLGDITVYHGQDGAHIYGLGEGPGDAPVPVEEPEPARYRVEPGICRECGRPTDKDKNGRPYPICKSCKFGGNKKPEPEPAPDDSGTLFEKPESVPVPVPASTVMLDAKPEADDLAELLRKGKVDEFLDSAGHWHSTRFTRGLAMRLKDDGATPATLLVFWAILTVLEGLDKDKTIITLESLAALSMRPKSTVYRARKWLNDFDYITWDKSDHELGIGPSVSDIIDDDTTDGKEHWHSTRYTLDVVAQLVADGVSVYAMSVFWAILTVLEGLTIESGKIPNKLIAQSVGLHGSSLRQHIPSLSESKWITHVPGDMSKRNSRGGQATFGLGPKLTNK